MPAGHLLTAARVALRPKPWCTPRWPAQGKLPEPCWVPPTHPPTPPHAHTTHTPAAAIRFVLDELFTSLSQEDRRSLLHVSARRLGHRAGGGLPALPRFRC